MKLKKIIALALTLTSLATVFTGCGSKEAANNNNSSNAGTTAANDTADDAAGSQDIRQNGIFPAGRDNRIQRYTETVLRSERQKD